LPLNREIPLLVVRCFQSRRPPVPKLRSDLGQKSVGCTCEAIISVRKRIAQCVIRRNTIDASEPGGLRLESLPNEVAACTVGGGHVEQTIAGADHRLGCELPGKSNPWAELPQRHSDHLTPAEVLGKQRSAFEVHSCQVG